MSAIAEVLDPQTANAIARVRKEQENRERQFKQWDNLLTTDDFCAFLASRLLRLEEAYPTLPYDASAEMAVIGAICMEGTTAEIAIGPLHPAHFQFPETGDALRAIATLRQQQRQGKTAPIDITTIASTMRRQRTFVNDGERGKWTTSDFLKECCEQCPCAENIAAYVEAVMCTARLRFQHWLGLTFARKTLEAEAEPEQLLNAMRLGLDTIERRGYVDLKTIFETTK
ncbi:hypothetical protein IAD21_00604 [Abditibacteriota bacterium]|nr:hypothetical protein IAD21_00604 [Abditibacteriota bacterium]